MPESQPPATLPAGIVIRLGLQRIPVSRLRAYLWQGSPPDRAGADQPTPANPPAVGDR